MKLNFLNTKNYKKIIVAVAIGSLALSSACSKAPEGVIATVNGTEISQETFVKHYAAQRNQFIMTNGEEALSKPLKEGDKKTADQSLKENTLKNLEQLEVIRQDAEKSNIKVDMAKVDQQINTVIEQMGGEEVYKEQLASIGATPEFYKEYATQLQLMNAYYENKVKEFETTDEEVSKHYEKNKKDYFTAKASHILVATEDVKKANELKKKIDSGEDFAKLAKENSIDPGSAAKGGSLGEFKNGTMVAEFNDAIKLMKVGDISDPVKTQFGYHIIKLEERTQRPLDEFKDELKGQLTQEKFTAYVEKIQKDAKIKDYLDLNKEIEIPEEYKIKKEAKQQETKQDTPTEPEETQEKSE